MNHPDTHNENRAAGPFDVYFQELKADIIAGVLAGLHPSVGPSSLKEDPSAHLYLEWDRYYSAKTLGAYLDMDPDAVRQIPLLHQQRVYVSEKRVRYLGLDVLYHLDRVDQGTYEALKKHLSETGLRATAAAERRTATVWKLKQA